MSEAVAQVTTHSAVAPGGMAFAPGSYNSFTITPGSPKPSTLPPCQEFQRPQVNPDFVVRPKIQSKMVEILPVEATSEVSSKIMILTTHGMGGVGKTQLAQYHYLNTQYPYSFKAWFYADSRDTLVTNYLNLADRIGLKFDDKTALSVKLETIRSWLESQTCCLLVFDNVERESDLTEFLPRTGTHHILMTSRNAIPFAGAKSIDIDVMEASEAITLLKTMLSAHAPEREYDAIEEAAIRTLVIDELGRLPLAIAQAGAYIRENPPLSVAAYLDLYQARKAEYLAKSEKGTPVHPEFRKQDSAAGLRWGNKHEPVWVTYDIVLAR